jgi:hypothetical protein
LETRIKHNTQAVQIHDEMGSYLLHELLQQPRLNQKQQLHLNLPQGTTGMP